MKLAVNYSPILVELIHDHPDLPVDYIKVPLLPFPDCFTRQFDPGIKLRPLLPHPAQPGVLSLGAAQPEQRFNAPIISEIIRRTAPPYLSTHLDAHVDYFPQYRSLQHLYDRKLAKIIKERFLSAIAFVKEQTGLPLVVENFPYYDWYQYYRIASEPELICEVCAEGDCGFLLDIAHARCSAWSLKVEIEDYLKALPLNRLREIHLSGVLEFDYGMCDTHTALSERDYTLLQTVLEWARPEIVTLEYGGMPEQIVNRFGVKEPISRNQRSELEAMLGRLGEIIAKYR